MYQELEVSAILTHLRQRNQTEKMHTMLTSVLLFSLKKTSVLLLFPYPLHHW
jgi:hypothetical protein